jgi:hypothetical protein
LTAINIPNNWKPRKYQWPLWNYLQEGGKRAIEIAHRRWGKDDVALNFTATQMVTRPATYWHCFPEYAQARKAIWTAVDPHTGKRRIDQAFPPGIVKTRNEQEMFIQFHNGSTWQIIGSDRYDSTVGAGPAGIVYSEWALANPSAWGYHRPMIQENNGWAVFITTPRGNNHAKAMYDMAAKSPDWFAEVSDIRVTGALTPEQAEQALEEYQAIYGRDFGLAYFEQEYLCSFAGAMVGAIFGGEINRAERDGRIKEVAVDYAHPVHTAWDLGAARNNPIWCFQVIAGQLRIVDFYRPESDDLEEWVAWLNGKGYNGIDFVPHDIIATDWGAKRTRLETLTLLKRKPHRIPKVSIQDGINAGNQSIRVAIFDAERCKDGIEGLKNYRREWDDDLKTFRENPVKDWSEHIGSAWRYLGLAWREIPKQVEKPKVPDRLEYVVTPSGVIQGNLTARQAVEAMVKRKRREA